MPFTSHYSGRSDDLHKWTRTFVAISLAGAMRGLVARRMGGANGSRDCAPDDKLRDTHRTHAKQADGFRKRSTHPTRL